ncbi:hypothetical protein CVT24_002885 [Panaeolus cyanescens]|uniref:Uncharacterized protein n=1 Tax=Panaeolus cyanescens TaxID=181874 RepID=A0A409YXQ4_9AGAR|nr:hypothetical protein CVT24_002885 [Panaeolus cyanescens]
MIVYRNELYPSSVNAAWDEQVKSAALSRRTSCQLPIYSPTPSSVPCYATTAIYQLECDAQPQFVSNDNEVANSNPISSKPFTQPPKGRGKALKELGRRASLVVTGPAAMAGIALYMTGVIIEGAGLALKSLGCQGKKLFRETK